MSMNRLLILSLLAVPTKLLAASYIINLQSTTTPVDVNSVKPIPGISQKLFTSIYNNRGTKWHRLQLGHFADHQSAKRSLERLKKRYPGAWIAKVNSAAKKGADLPKIMAVKGQNGSNTGKVSVTKKRGGNLPNPLSNSSNDAKRFIITLQSSTSPIDLKSIKPIPGISQSFLTSIYNKGGVKWHRLQLGYFNDHRSARASLKSLTRRFPGAWISKVSVATKKSANVKSANVKKVVTNSANRTTPRLADNRTNFPYVVNLQITKTAVTPATLPPLTLPKGAVLYTTATQRREQAWHYLRAGFFADREEANHWAKRLSSNYPAAKVLKVTRHERKNAFSSLIEPSSLAKIEVTDKVALRMPQKAAKGPSLADAKRAMLDGDYSRAIQVYRAILGDKVADDAARQSALELLAFAYEREGNSTMARKHYQDYLTRYPKGDASERVRQRLASMESATAKSKEKLRAKRSVLRQKESLYGSFSVYYRHDADIENDNGDNTNQSSIQSYLDLTSRTRTDEHDFRARFSGGYVTDLLNSDNNGMNLSNLNIDYRNQPGEWSTIVGRQSGNSGGVLGRFDGIQVSKEITATSKINFVTGSQVDSSSDALLKGSKKFYGISSDLGTIAQSWDFQAYAIQQSAGSFLDRRAIGGEVRYFKPNGTLFGLFDYDLNLKSINTMLLIGGYTMADKSRVNFMVDQRNSPTITLSNALQGQAATSLEELALSYNSDEIKQLAKDRTARSRSMMVGYSRPLNSRFQLSSDLTVSNISATPASGGVAATDASGNSYYINLRLNVKELLLKGDLSLLSLSYTDSPDMTTTTTGFNSRFPYRDHWRLNPRVYLDYRQNRVAGDNYLVLRPSIKASTQRWKKHTFEFDAGLDFTNQTDVENSYYISLGYHNRF